MKLEISEGILPILNWSYVSEDSWYYNELADSLNNGDCIICNSDVDYEDGELCAYVFFDDFETEIVERVFSGRVQFITNSTNHLAPFTYAFYPENELKIKAIGHCKCCENPEAVMLKNKKL